MLISHDDRRASVINIEFRLDNRLMEPRGRVGQIRSNRLIAGTPLVWVRYELDHSSTYIRSQPSFASTGAANGRNDLSFANPAIALVGNLA